MSDGVNSLPKFGDRYRVERELGRGGMATVFLCIDTKIDRPVAIKLLHPELAAAVGAERFHREIRIATGLTHPNILPAYDSGELDGSLYYVMPFVEGESLRDRIVRERQLSVQDSVRIASEIAGALHFAHSKGIVHRDIKPENILLEAEHAVLADFGIARAKTAAGEVEQLTQTGMSLGTPSYMSPEQALGEKNIDGRSDQYSLACVLYEMLAGQPPFLANTMHALVAKHLGEQVPLISTVRPAVPDELEDVILRALEKVPADRFGTMQEFADALSSTVAATGTWARRTTPRTTAHTLRATRNNRVVDGPATRRRGYIAAAAVATVIIAAGGVAWFTRDAESESALNLNRVAVTYFQDLSPTRNLGYLADGLTESLIERLQDVQAIDVVSRNGVAAFRDVDVGPDSIGRNFNAGLVVTGDVVQQGQNVEVSMQLREGRSGAPIARTTFRIPADQAMTARDSVAELSARMLRRRLGDEVRLREEREAAGDIESWSLLQRGERARKDGEGSLSSDRGRAVALLLDADSLFRRSADRDPKWSEPHTRRGMIAFRRSRLERNNVDALRLIDSGLVHAGNALAIAPRNADALELRGTLRYERYLKDAIGDADAKAELLRLAEEDLRAATAVNPSQANAYNVLSALFYRSRYDPIEAKLAAEKALEADAYLTSANAVHWRLFATSYDIGQLDQAIKWCSAGRQRFPNDPNYVLCRLYIGLMPDNAPNIDAAWRDVQRYVELSPEPRRTFNALHAAMLAASQIAASGPQFADSARNVVARSRTSDRRVDEEGTLIFTEGLVHLRLGERKEALRLLKLYLTEFPLHRPGLARNTWWWKDLQNEPEYRDLIGSKR